MARNWWKKTLPGLAVCLFFPVTALAGTIYGSIGVSYDTSSVSTAQAPSDTNSSKNRSLFFNLNYRSFLWHPQFLTYTAGLTATYNALDAEQGSGGIRSKNFNYQGSLFNGRPLNLTLFGSHLTTSSFGDLFNLSTPTILVPIVGPYQSKQNRYGLNGSWRTSLFQRFSFGYDRGSLDQTSNGFHAKQNIDNGFFHLEKDTRHARNAFDFLLRNEEYPDTSGLDQSLLTATLVNAFHLLAQGYLTFQNAYNSTSNRFSPVDNRNFEPPSTGISLPQPAANVRSYYSNANWNHSPTWRYRYLFNSGYSVNTTEGFDSRQWFYNGEASYSIFKWVSVFGGAGANKIRLKLREDEETNRVNSLKAGSLLSGKYKWLSGAFSASVSKGRIRQEQNEESGDFSQRFYTGSLALQLSSKYNSQVEYVREQTRNDVSDLLNYDRNKFSSSLRATNVRSIHYGVSYVDEKYSSIEPGSALSDSRTKYLTTFVSRSLTSRGSVSFRYGRYSQTLTQQQFKGNYYDVSGTFRIMPRLTSSLDVRIEDIHNPTFVALEPSEEIRRFRDYRLKVEYEIGRSRMEFRVFRQQNVIEFIPPQNEFDVRGQGFLILFRRDFSFGG